MEDYGLSPVLKEFTAQTKNVMSNKDVRFKRLFKSMKDTGEMKLIRSVLTYIISNPYQVSDKDILNIFSGL